MWRLIAIVAISCLTLALTVVPVYAACSSSQVNECNDANNACTNDCNVAGAPQSCYTSCVCGYYGCRAGCGDGMVPEGCSSS